MTVSAKKQKTKTPKSGTPVDSSTWTCVVRAGTEWSLRIAGRQKQKLQAGLTEGLSTMQEVLSFATPLLESQHGHAHTCNPHPWEIEEGSEVQDHPWLHYRRWLQCGLHETPSQRKLETF